MGEGSVGLSPIEAERETLFWFNALLIASNGTDSRVGSLTADWEVLAHDHLLRGPSRTGVQRIEREDEPRRVSLEVMLRGTGDRTGPSALAVRTSQLDRYLTHT